MKEKQTTARGLQWRRVGIALVLAMAIVAGMIFGGSLLSPKKAVEQRAAEMPTRVGASGTVTRTETSGLFGEKHLDEAGMRAVFPNAGKPNAGLIDRKAQPAMRSVSHSSGSTMYIVREGDWLSTICPSDWKEVAVVNTLANPDLIYVGQKLELTEKCNEREFVARRGSTKTTLVVAKEETSAPAPIREEKASEKAMEQVSVVPAPVVQGNVSRVRMDDDGLRYCEPNLPQGEKAFQWRQPGRNPIGDEDPREYLEALAISEGLPPEAREYFLAELRKGDQGDFVQMDLRYCQYLGAMVGKKIHDKIVVHRHTVLNWPIEVAKTMRTNLGKRKQTWEEARMNGTARKYVFVVGSDRWVLLRANICGNLILRREVITPVPQEMAPPEPEPVPVQTPPTYTGRCVPRSRPQDCAMPGCVLRVPLPDATPACAASCESAPEMNSDPLGNAKGIHPVVDGTCPLTDTRPDIEPLATFTVLGGAFINETDPEKICRMTPDVEYRGMQLVCLADGSVMKRGE